MRPLSSVVTETGSFCFNRQMGSELAGSEPTPFLRAFRELYRGGPLAASPFMALPWASLLQPDLPDKETSRGCKAGLSCFSHRPLEHTAIGEVGDVVGIHQRPFMS